MIYFYSVLLDSSLRIIGQTELYDSTEDCREAAQVLKEIGVCQNSLTYVIPVGMVR